MCRPRTATLLGRLATGMSCALVWTVPAVGQTTAGATINATAFVLLVAPLTATGVADLTFGTVTVGTSATPLDLAGDAGRFDVTGEPGVFVSVTYTLPTDLAGPGGTIPVTFGPADGLRWAPFPTAFTTFDPAAAFTTGIDPGGTLTLGITGTVTVPLGTVPGTYTATITLTVAYL